MIGGGFIWWQDQTSMRAKDLIGLTPEHVEVEGADGTTRIHPLDEPEDQAVAEAKAEGETPVVIESAPEQAASTALALPAASQVPAAAPDATTPASAPAVVAPVVAPAVAPVATPTAAAAPVAGAGKVGVQYSADCWTQVTDATGKVLFGGLKRKGENLEVSGKPPLTLRLGFARGAQVTYNGQSVDVAPFTSGETARLKLGQ